MHVYLIGRLRYVVCGHHTLTATSSLADARSQHDRGGRANDPGLPLRVRPQHLYTHLLRLHVPQRGPGVGFRRDLSMAPGTFPSAPSNARTYPFRRRSRTRRQSDGICLTGAVHVRSFGLVRQVAPPYMFIRIYPFRTTTGGATSSFNSGESRYIQTFCACFKMPVVIYFIITNFYGLDIQLFTNQL